VVTNLKVLKHIRYPTVTIYSTNVSFPLPNLNIYEGPIKYKSHYVVSPYWIRLIVIYLYGIYIVCIALIECAYK